MCNYDCLIVCLSLHIDGSTVTITNQLLELSSSHVLLLVLSTTLILIALDFFFLETKGKGKSAGPRGLLIGSLVAEYFCSHLCANKLTVESMITQHHWVNFHLLSISKTLNTLHIILQRKREKDNFFVVCINTNV